MTITVVENYQSNLTRYQDSGPNGDQPYRGFAHSLSFSEEGIEGDSSSAYHNTFLSFDPVLYKIGEDDQYILTDFGVGTTNYIGGSRRNWLVKYSNSENRFAFSSNDEAAWFLSGSAMVQCMYNHRPLRRMFDTPFSVVDPQATIGRRGTSNVITFWHNLVKPLSDPEFGKVAYDQARSDLYDYRAWPWTQEIFNEYGQYGVFKKYTIDSYSDGEIAPRPFLVGFTPDSDRDLLINRCAQARVDAEDSLNHYLQVQTELVIKVRALRRAGLATLDRLHSGRRFRL